MVDSTRMRELNTKPVGDGPVVYWMSRDQRVHDNWALLYAIELANARKVAVYVVFALRRDLDKHRMTARSLDFMLRGLEEVEKELQSHGIGFSLVQDDAEIGIPLFAKRVRAGVVVTDFSPLRRSRSWKDKIAMSLQVSMREVDSHNIVPAWIASDKQEYAAQFFRRRLQPLIGKYLVDFPPLRVSHSVHTKKTNWRRVRSTTKVDKTVAPVSWIEPGESQAKRALSRFVKNGLLKYSTERNDPNTRGQSDLSPYLHFGQLSAQRVAMSVMASHPHSDSARAFLDELITWRELAENFCFYNVKYDTVEAAPKWASESHARHSNDKREYIYSLTQFEQGETHDDLWNAAQWQMVRDGKMHGYLRMYWAKKILEWTKSPKDALKIAITLNDKYELDGRDPNGYAGIAWSILGVHDRPWFNRPIFGQIRYMSYNGCKQKFDVNNFIEKYANHR